MKTRILLSTLFASFLLTTNLSAQQPKFEWAKQMGGAAGYDYGNSITTDINGNIYTTGTFKGPVYFDPEVGSYVRNGDLFIQKLDTQGNLIWIKQMGGESNVEGNSITIDTKGNVYTTGYFEGTVDFDPGTGTFNLTSAGGSDIFIQKLDSDGNLLWVKQMGGLKSDFALSITTDTNGNVYTTGYFSGTVDFDPGINTSNFTSKGGDDIFIQKLDTAGNLLWVKQLGATDYDRGYSITTDINGNIYTTGSFKRTVDFDPSAGTARLTSNGERDIFIQKLDTKGNLLWVKQIGGLGWDIGYSITTDISGNVYTTGVFEQTVDFEPGEEINNLTSNVGSGIFIQKLDTNGVLLWARKMGGLGLDYGSSITTDTDGNSYTTGIFYFTANFDTGTANTNLTAFGQSDAPDVFIQKLDAKGNLLWVKQIGGEGIDIGHSITTDDNGNVYTTGTFEKTADFDPNEGIFNFTSLGSSDIFILKINQTATVGITENTFTENIQVYPNPTTGNFAIKFETIQKELSVRILSITGQIIETKTFQNTDFVRLKLNQPNGIYLVDVLNEKGNRTGFRLIKK